MSVSAKKISAKIGSTTVVGLVHWEVEEAHDPLDGTTAADAGYGRADVGVGQATIRIRGVLDLTSGSYTPIRSGTTISTLKLYRDLGDTTEAWNFPTVVVHRSTQGAEIRGRFEISMEGKSTGSYTHNNPPTA